MPFYTDTDNGINTINKADIPEELNTTEMGLAESVFTLGNSVYSTFTSEFVASKLNPFQTIDPDFDGVDRAEKDGIDNPDILRRMLNTQNEDQYRAVLSDAERSRKAREVLSNSPVSGLLGVLGAGILDPINFIGGAKALQMAKQAKGIVQGVRAGAAGALPSLTASTALLTLGDPLKNSDEIAMEISVGALLGGAIGGARASKLFTKNRKQLVSSAKDQILNNKSLDTSPKGQLDASDSVGAARAEPLTLDEESILEPNIVSKIANKTFGKFSPTVRAMQAPFRSVREYTEKLTTLDLNTNKNLKDIANEQSAWANIKVAEGESAVAQLKLEEAYTAYRASNKGKQRMPRDRFEELVSRIEIRGGHITQDLYERFPEIKGNEKFLLDAHKNSKTSFWIPLSERAIEVDLLDVKLRGSLDKSYLSRWYKRDKIVANRDVWNQKLRGWANTTYRKTINAIKQELRNAKNKDAKIELRQKLDAYFETPKEQYIEEVIDEITNKILGTRGRHSLYQISPSRRGPLAERTFDIDDIDIEDFLELNQTKLINRTSRIANAEIELKRSFGTTQFEDVVSSIRDAEKPLIDSIKDPVEKLKMYKQLQSSINDFENMWELVRGTYQGTKNPDPDTVAKRIGGAIRTINYLRLLGGVTLSSAPDVGITVAHFGFAKTFGKAVKVLLRNVTGSKEFKNLSKSEATRVGAAVQRVLNSRAFSLYEIGDPFARGNKFEKGLDNLGKNFGNVNLMNFWNDFWEETVVHLETDRILRLVNKDNLTKSETLAMTRLGLGKNERLQIKKMINQHSTEEEGFILPNSDLWDKITARKFRAALRSSVDSIIIKKDPGNVPIHLEHPLGKILAQFTSFAFASNQKFMLSALQTPDVNKLVGMTTMFSIGMMVSLLKSKASGRDIEGTDEWIIDGIDKSGIFSIPMLLNSYGDRLGGLSIQNLADDRDRTKYDVVKGVGSIFGPTGDIIGKLGSAALAGQKNTDFTQSNLDDLISLMPYQNLYNLQSLWKKGSKALGKELGLKQPKKRGKRNSVDLNRR